MMISSWIIALYVVSIGIWLYVAYHAERGMISKVADLALLCSAIAFPAAIDTFLFERAVADRGVVSTVLPISSYEEQDGTWGKSYMAVVSFKTLSGEVVSDKRGLSAETLAKVKAHEPIEVSYLPENPNRIWFRDTGSNAVKELLFGLLGLAIGLGILYARRTMKARGARM